ncbi:hypothetical protein BTO30_00100 [Domibacillus antri]|uniref:Spore cortex biosynthesis protein YabQ n=1 Tax=Domibacillus antri TaxID=1714264 RepID=A0A1Q8QAC0_9BACI|nr:spore cortex biosynthesis protein YabQ [Domibacillus antri]OLN24289.1 hypothetical protein BTO30_00100 [Domibacillus antri]
MNLDTQVETALLMAAMGCCFGMLLEVYRRIRPQKTALLFLGDSLFWSGYALLLFTALYKVNDGQVRLPFFLFLLFGLAVYGLFIRRFFLPVVNGVFLLCRFLFNMVQGIVNIFIVWPVRFIMKITVSLARMCHFLLLWILKKILLRPWAAIGRLKK